MFDSYSEAVDWLFNRVNYERLGAGQYGRNDFKLERMQKLLNAIGNPHEQIPVVHIAGTKGKGTTAAIVDSILREAGYRVGLFTSPHMFRIEERFLVNGQPISEERFVNLVTLLAGYVSKTQEETPELSPTFFEITTAMAWLYFLEENADLAVLEVGLGGRLDSTNLCRPLVTAISSISLDHTRLLGDTVASITREKAGIIKASVPVMTSSTDPFVCEDLKAIALQKGCPFQQLGQDFQVETVKPWCEQDRFQTVRYTQSDVPEEKIIDVQFSLPGQIYACNLGLALACIDQLNHSGYTITDTQKQRGILNVSLPLRFEILQEAPQVIVDAAHNPAALEALMETLPQYFPERPVTLILAISRDKDYAGMCQTLRGISSLIVTQYLGNIRSLPAAELVEVIEQEENQSVLLAESPAEALEMALQVTPSHGIIVASGSLFLAAEVRQLVKPEILTPSIHA
ncbi:folylpolyglutamate synthase/dihydrofolate synthase family protein [Rubinisphaera sp.]|uniref:bifunctional folylpolyglutamate synthase/dihydrofolate synthase n=1 Tax=Rubinisphaera sp. TaxID=2024857 RepID=UPI000C0DA711|nr:folylpolyglutamate synthase/dihydrofolate synthase family protein [Rubinisphaera sp.]MBV11387.1 bifunctional folylpolyglutamate synthase/dihydrofolate synthase [Rubinisphaera sp.]HCS50052.1 bifunctional folylpolyglutamate synthase/dihydrofolate synthase [Planctomycetaceae bacterium]|tara:strand:+ start:11889 stop:13262 length:1374 start_codon:yes stop_codon:yes gene_type:complete